MDGSYLDIGGRAAAPPTLAMPQARELAAVLSTGVLSYAHLVECRRSPQDWPDGEAVIFEVDVERPQVAAHPVRRVERIAAVFPPAAGQPPEVLALRRDFPQVPHINLRTCELPRSLCLDDRPWHDASRRWTAAGFVERVRWWLAHTARGSLHQDDQPLEPLMLDALVPLILPADMRGAVLEKHQILTVKSKPGSESAVAFQAERVESVPGGSLEPEYLAIALRCVPQPHGVVRHHPNTLDQLHDLTNAAGLDLKRELTDRLRGWRHSQRVRTSRLIILLTLPKQRRAGGRVEESDHFAVACFDTITEIGVKLGVWDVNRPVGKEKRRRAGKAPKVPKAGEPISVFLLRPVFELTPEQATQLGGDPPRSVGRCVAIGAGALGSQVLLNMARAGHGGWTVIDDDLLLPHNLQRHALDGFSVGSAKATAVAARMSSLFGKRPAADAIAANFLAPGKLSTQVERAVAEADAVIDLSASVAVARQLAWDKRTNARYASLFLNPTGTDLVLLAEGVGRPTPLDSLEMQYYRAVLREGDLAGHLLRTTDRISYSASCRDVSARLPTHLVALHAAIGAGALAATLGRADASIRVWRVDPASLAVSPIAIPPAAARRGAAGEWTVVVDDALLSRLSDLRAARLPNETGGVLLGSYDMGRRAVYVVDTIPSPPDSAEWPTLYIRGCEGLPEAVAAARERTGDQVEYVGEWHSHPDGATTRPSADDSTVFTWLTGHMAVEGLPALMAIVGEDAGASWYVGQMRPDSVWSVRHAH